MHCMCLLILITTDLWVMPRENQHITALEVTHSKTAPEIQALVEKAQGHIPAITDYTHDHRARLIKPLIGYDASAIALSFVPAAGAGLHSGRTSEDDYFTYHHLRRDLFNLCRQAGLQVESRYVVPSSHLTIGRFIYAKDFEGEDGSPRLRRSTTGLRRSSGPSIMVARYLMEESFMWERSRACTVALARFGMAVEILCMRVKDTRQIRARRRRHHSCQI
jgi:hypothetical protein